MATTTKPAAKVAAKPATKAAPKVAKAVVKAPAKAPAEAPKAVEIPEEKRVPRGAEMAPGQVLSNGQEAYRKQFGTRENPITEFRRLRQEAGWGRRAFRDVTGIQIGEFRKVETGKASEAEIKAMTKVLLDLGPASENEDFLERRATTRTKSVDKSLTEKKPAKKAKAAPKETEAEDLI